MNEYKHIIFLLAITAAVLVAVCSTLRAITFKPFLSPREERLAGLLLEPPEIRSERQTRGGAAKDGVTLSFATPRGFPSTPLSEAVREAGGERVTLILFSQGQKIAVMDSRIVKEGDRIDQGRIVRIERDRVLLGTKSGSKWVSLQPESETPGDRSPAPEAVDKRPKEKAGNS